MGVATGRFEPLPSFGAVRHVFSLFSIGKRAEYYRERDALPLSIRRDDGVLVPTNCIHIADFSEELGPGNIELEIVLEDVSVWNLFPSSM